MKISSEQNENSEIFTRFLAGISSGTASLPFLIERNTARSLGGGWWRRRTVNDGTINSGLTIPSGTAGTIRCTSTIFPRLFNGLTRRIELVFVPTPLTTHGRLDLLPIGIPLPGASRQAKLFGFEVILVAGTAPVGEFGAFEICHGVIKSLFGGPHSLVFGAVADSAGVGRTEADLVDNLRAVPREN